MNDVLIESLKKSFKGKITLIQTHISWLLLSNKFVFKIKKPVKFSFLDFSSLKKRKFYCFQELMLNSKLSKGVYLKVLPVKKAGNKIFIGKGKGKIIDFALQMRRLPEKRKMSILLKEKKVKEKDIKALAKAIALFHLKAKRIKKGIYGSPLLLKQQINDLRFVKGIIKRNLGNSYASKIDFILSKSNAFIQKNNSLLVQRKKFGFIRQCHGDLHSGNIFLMKKPVIFDCIEFNEKFSLIDTASDIAFLAMDLDSFNKKNLSNLLINEYLKHFKDKDLMHVLPLFECYRANVRAKVNALQLLNSKTLLERNKKKAEIKKYLLLAENYALML